MKKLFTLALAMLASVGLWATSVTFSASEFKSVKTVTKNGITMTLVSSMSNAGEQQVWKDGSTAKKADVVQIANSANADHTAHWVEISSTTKITAMSITAVNNQTDGNVYKIPVVYWKGEVAAAFDGLEIIGLVDKARASAPVAQNLTPIAGAKVARLYRTIRVNADTTSFSGASGYVTIGDGKTAMILSIDVTAEDACTDPESTIKEDTTLYVNNGYNIGFNSINTNGCTVDVKKNGAAAVDDVDYSKTNINNYTFLKAGEFVITISQAKDANNHCAVEESVTVTVLDASPVTAVTIDGPTAGVIGQELTYTATAAGATAYEWYLDDVKQGSDSAKFIYTAVKGNHSIVCKARNNFNEAEEWIASDAKAVTITKLCGELIKAEYNASTKTSTVTGVVGGTADRNTQDNGKLGSNGHYYGVALTSGSFMAGDTVKVVASALNGGNTATIYADKTGTTLLGSAAFDTESLTAEVVLTQGANVVYLYRKDSGCNPNIGSLSVIRPCEESDNNNASVTINGEAAEKSGTVFNYTLSASYDAATVAVEIALEHPLATLMEDHAASFTMATPEVGTPTVETFKVKAENGEQAWYSIFVNKSAELSHDATLKSLSVTGYTLSPEFAPSVKSYYITKAYGADDPATDKVVYETNHANATAVVQALVDALVVTVTAEDGTTHISYTINIETADAPKSLSKVLFSNGFDAFIDNTNHTVKAFYLSGTEAPTATTITAGAGTAGELADGKIIVTGADSKTCEYIVTLEAVTPNTDVVEESAEAGVFAGTEAWVKNGLLVYGNAAGFNGGKYVLRRQLKSGDAADDQRVIAGWVRAYFFVGNASKLELANTTKNVKVKYAVDGGAYTETEANPIEIALEEGNHMIEIVTNQSGGDCNLSAPKLVKRVPTALDNAADGVKAQKFIENGQMFIQKDGKIYNVMGMEIR